MHPSLRIDVLRRLLIQVANFAGLLVVGAIVVATIVVHSRFTVLEQTAIAKPGAQVKQHVVRSQLDDDDEADQEEYSTIVDGTAYPNQEDAFMKQVDAIFGWHLFFLILILNGTALLWVYVFFIRPQSWFRDFQKHSENSSAGFGTATPGTVAHIDENNLTGSLTLVPGEAVFFNEELALSFGGVFGSCSKLSVTNLRIIAQKSETIFFGTCSVTSPTAIGTKQLRVFCFRVVSRTHSDMPSRSFAHIITHLSALNLSCPIRKFLHVSLWALISMKMLKRAETASLPDATSSLL